MERVWWKEAVGYELYPKSFKDSDGDGIGDLKGIVERLPYLKELGIDLLWVCPFFSSPMKDNGYDVADYYSIDPQFGTMEDMDLLLDRARELGIRVIVDMVLNHTSDQHEWFQKALKDPQSPCRDYYIFREGKEMPSNARSCFGGPVWDKAGEDLWYYHTFDKSQPDLNWECEKLRQEIYKILNYWLSKGVSGFRLDAITYIKKGASLNMAEPQGEDGLHDVADIGLNQPGIGEFLMEMKRSCVDGTDTMTVAEAPGVPYDELEPFIGEDGYFSMLFDFSYADIDLAPGGNWYHQADWTFSDLKKLLFHSQMSVQKQGWGAVYLENHDQSRSLNKYFREKAADSREPQKRFLQGSALATLLFGLRGTVFLYQGEELGMVNCYFDSIEEYNDLNSIDQYHRALRAGCGEQEALKYVGDRSRDNSRTPFPWSGEANGGFSTGKPWLKLNPDYATNNAASQTTKETSLFSFYKKLIAYRKSDEGKEILTYGSVREITGLPEAVIGLEREGENGECISVYVNMDDVSTQFPARKGDSMIDNYETPLWEGDELLLRPYEAVMVRYNRESYVIEE